MVKRINLSLSARTGRGKLVCVGGPTVDCGGVPGFAYPADSTVQGRLGVDKFLSKESGEFPGAIMNYAILWIGQRGVYFHEWGTLDANVGCVHILPGDAKLVFEWVDGPTRIVLTWT
jgi:hypothetical protein